MRYAGIDVGKGRHTVAVLDDQGRHKAPFTFAEDQTGFDALVARLGLSNGLVVALEATGHYWRNVATWLVDQGYDVRLYNPAQTAKFAQAQLRRAKTDALDAVGIARCAMSVASRHEVDIDAGLVRLRELSRWRVRQNQDLGDRVRQLHRQVDLVFPELPRVIKDLSTRRATALLARWPTAVALATAHIDDIASLIYDGRHRIGDALARRVAAMAKESIAQHAGAPYDLIVPQLCDDIRRMQVRVAELEGQLRAMVEANGVGRLLMSIPGIGFVTASAILAEVGNPARYESGHALAADVGVVPGVWQSGRTSITHRAIDPRGKARLRHALWMPTLSAVRSSPWLKAFYERLKANGKRSKVALIAAMRKLLTAIYAVAKRGTPFVEPNAPVLIAQER